MKAADLTFLEIEDDPPPFLVCNCCGALGVRLGAVIPVPDRDGDVCIVTLCSRACESVFKRQPKADEVLAALMAVASMARSRDEQWPEEI